MVSDETTFARNAILAKALLADPIPLSQFTQRDLIDDPSVVFDVDLRKVEQVRHLKGVLTEHGAGCRMFLVDPDIRVMSVHANVLGADVVLPSPGNPAQINAAIRSHFGATGPANKAVLDSISRGADALDLTFQALSEGQDLQTQSVLDAGGRIADAISGVGVDEWLATVKGYHMGTFQHCMLVTGVAAGFGARTGMARRDIIKLTIAGLLHDIGKAKVPVAILDKPGALTPAETAVMQKHPADGYDYLSAHSSIDAGTRGSVRHHHELLDGTGYPDRLSGSQIDDLTRIITICDIYAALVERRSYKPTRTPEDALTVLEAMAGAGKLELSLVRELRNIMVPRG